MANTIQIRRGAKASLPTLASGELGWCSDTFELFVGTGATNYEVLMKALFDANSILAANSDNTPAAVTVAESRIVGRKTGGNIGALTASEVMALLSGGAGADFDMNSQKITGLATPTASGDATNKSYVDGLIDGLDWQESVLDRFDPSSGLPGTPSEGDRYISTATANTWTEHYIYEYRSSAWAEIIPNEGYCCRVEDEDIDYVFNGTAWVTKASGTNHNNLAGLDGGQAGEYYHLTQAQHIVATQAASSEQNGYMTSTQASKLDGIEESADVTDSANVDSAGAVMESDFTAQTILAAVANGTPAPVTVAEDRIVGRKTGGNVGVLTGAEVMAILSGQAGAALNMNSQKITGLSDPENDQDAATKAWVLSNAGSSTFVALTDTPAGFAGHGGKIVRVNSTPDGLEFVSFTSTYLEDTPTDDELNKAPTSNWAYDHAAATTGVHGAGGNTLLHSGSTIDGGAFA